MNNQDFNNTMSDYLRLANLKNLFSGKLRGRGDKQIEELQHPIYKGAAAPPPEIEPSQFGNYDVRANRKIEPPPMQQSPEASEGKFSQIWNDISSGLGNFKNDFMQAGEEYKRNNPDPSLVSNPNQEGLFQKLSNLYKLTGAPQLNAQQAEDQNVLLQAPKNLIENPEESMIPGEAGVAPPPPPVSPPSVAPVLENQPPSPAQTPGVENVEPGDVKPGAVSEVLSNPTLKSEIDRIFGKIDPGMAQASESFEKAMDAYRNDLDALRAGLDEQSAANLEKIKSRNLSTQDKIVMAIALIAPMIVSGLIGGKEAALGALGGGVEGFAKALGQKEKTATEAQEKNTEIAANKAEIAKEKAGIIPLTQEFKSKLENSIPNKGLRDIFVRDGILINGKLALNSGNPNLPIKADAVRDEKDYERLKKEVPKLSQSVSTLDKAERIMDSMYKLADFSIAVRDQKNPLQWVASLGGLNPFYDPITGALKAFIPYTRDEVIDKDTGKPYKISELLGTLRAQLADAWRDAHGNNSNAFKATEQHFDKQIPDPSSWKAFLSGQSDLTQFVKQLDLVKNNFEEAVNYIDEQGFDTSDLKKKFAKTERNSAVSEKERKKDRAERAAEQAIRG